MKDETLAWLSHTDENLDVARLALKHGHLNASIQNAQQAVEKYLKAVIIEKDLEFRRTHSIRERENPNLCAIEYLLGFKKNVLRKVKGVITSPYKEEEKPI